MSERSGQPPVHPLRGGSDDPPPPSREQLPLPRREQQTHLEPQLRKPGGAGAGTPFAAFAAPDPAAADEEDRDGPDGPGPGGAEYRRP